MSLASLDEQEREVVQACLKATVESPFFPEWEFGTIFGLTRDEVRRVLESWPMLDESDKSVVIAINNSFNNLLHYPIREDMDLWPRFIPVSRPELATIFHKWKGREPGSPCTGRDYFHDMM